MKLIRMHGHDRANVGTFITRDGYFVAKDAPIARTGIQSYYASEFDLQKHVPGMKATDVLRLYRAPEEVFDAASLESFKFVPVTIDHPNVALVTADNWPDLAKGEVRDIAAAGEFVTATIVVRSKDAQDAVNGGMTGLSAGYEFELDLTPGTTPAGEPYDGLQRNIRGNHVALVEKARCGAACRIGDTENGPNGGAIMADKKIVVNGITIEVSDTAASVIEQALKTAHDSVESANAKLAEAEKAMQTALTAKDVELAEVRKQVLKPEQITALVNDRVQTLTVAKKLSPAMAADGLACEQIHRAVVIEVAAADQDASAIAKAIVGSDDFKTADAGKVKLAFLAIGAAQGKATGNDADRAAAEALAGSGAGKESKLTGREKMLSGMQSGWQK